MLTFPAATTFGRRVPKQKFYQHLDVAAEVKRLFVEQVKLITWANKLSAQTLSLAPGEHVQEIEVFHIQLQDQDLDERVCRLMDQQIPYHLLFWLERPDGFRSPTRRPARVGTMPSNYGEATRPTGPTQRT